MKNNELDGIEKVIMSMAKSQRAKPRENLFEEIYAEYLSPPESIITQMHMRLAVAASVILLCFNSYLFVHTYNAGDTGSSEREDLVYSHELSLGNYNIYSE